MTPPLCACGCGRELTPRQLRRKGARYATRRCMPASIPPDERTRRLRKVWAGADPVLRAEWKARSGAGTDLTKWGEMIERWMDLGPREGIRAAYRAGYLAGQQSKYRTGRAKRGEGKAA